MAKFDPTLTPAVGSVFTELYMAETEDTALKQIFGVQGIPVISSPKEDITYRTLESDEEFASKGIRPYESIEVEVVYRQSQYKVLKKLSDENRNMFWYVKLPDETAGSEADAKPIVIKWKGSIDISIAEIALDDMLKCTLKIGKSTVPEILDGLPGGDTPIV